MTDTPSLFRVVLQVSDMDQAADFYSKLLSDKGRRVHESRHYFDCGPVILALVDATGGGEKAKPNPDYIYFSVGDIAGVHARARELGCLAKGEVHGASAGEVVTRPWGESSFYAHDPFGNRLCFVDRRTLFTGR